ncbi:hypothetical protein ABD07_03630 [Nitrosomonas oligotropha]|nr:hypothetical protein [Nitrosomonas oligotropha]
MIYPGHCTTLSGQTKHRIPQPLFQTKLSQNIFMRWHRIYTDKCAEYKYKSMLQHALVYSCTTYHIYSGTAVLNPWQDLYQQQAPVLSERLPG